MNREIKSLKQKWEDFLPASISILIVILSAYLIGYGIHILSRKPLTEPDTRTLEQIVQDKLKNCIKNSNPRYVPDCFSNVKVTI